jgi:hypothetical protein
MAFGDPNDPGEPEDDELPPDDWYEESATALPPEEEEEGLEPPPLFEAFEEIRAPPEYSACADAQHQE